MNGDKTIYTGFGFAVVIPTAQSLIFGTWAGMIALTLSTLSGSPSRWINTGFWFSLVAGVSWLFSVISWHDLINRLENPQGIQTGFDFNGSEPAGVRIELSQNDNRTLSYIDLPEITVDQMITLAKGLQSGATFAESTWTGGTGIFTRAQFSQLRSQLIKRNLLAWNSPGTPARGVTLTRSGRACMKYFSELTSRPPTLLTSPTVKG